ncbi:MAG TPA: hypothetical protein VJ953_07160 [Saprospiraceae bacterium]|nr:hypothetical protein [Saprospiraceae bacterium]
MINKTLRFLMVIACGWACQNQPAGPSIPTPPDNRYEEMEQGEKREIPAYYICYEGGGDNKLGLSIAFSEDGTAIEVKYRGQSEAIELREIDEKMSTEGAYPVIETTYQEMVEGQVNGIYVLTHAGNWDYAQYIRGRDEKEFSFTIDHEQSIQNDTYRTTPCYN